MSDRDALIPRHTRTELENARTKGQFIGWIQGAGVVLALGLLLKAVGWIPVLLVGGGAAYLAYRLFFARKK